MFATKKSILQFIAGVTEAFGRPGTLYLVGESSLVVEGKRSFCSEIIVAGEVTAEDASAFRSAVDEAASRAGLPVAIEHPADVIPLPSESSERARPLSDSQHDDALFHVRHFDPYTTAIRFIARGDEPDYDLVVAFLEMGWITMEELDKEVQKLLPRFSFETIQQDPAEFRRKYKGLTQIWLARSHLRENGHAKGRVGV